jgi:hypothetical protein
MAFPSWSLGTRENEGKIFPKREPRGSWSFQDGIPKLELGNEGKIFES